MMYAGLDLHKNFSVITIVDAQGKEMVKQKKLPNNGEIVEIFQEFDEPVAIAVEATRSWYWLYDLLEKNGMVVKLVHPLKTKAIASAKVKNDKIDSRILANLLRADLLPLSYVPPKPIRMQRELLRYRASLVRIQTGIKNRVHVILAKNNISHNFSDLFGKQGKEFLSSLSLPEVYRSALNGYLSVLGELEGQIKVVDKMVVVSAKDDEDAGLLITIPGIAYYSALLIKSESRRYKSLSFSKATLLLCRAYPLHIFFREHYLPWSYNQARLKVAEMDISPGNRALHCQPRTLAGILL